jgi:hypothetical protein
MTEFCILERKPMGTAEAERATHVHENYCKNQCKKGSGRGAEIFLLFFFNKWQTDST